jgi:hypothetical protein
VTFEWAWINSVLILLVFFYGLRKWNGPNQNLRIDAIEYEQKLLRGNVARIERDLIASNKTAVEINDRILRELEAIRMNGAQEHPIEEKLVKLEEGMFELERTIAAMPCAYHATLLVNGKKPEEEK